MGITFLPDHPSEDDFFGSHGRVAAAIADVIRCADGVNVVGLLGGWGSGKSTVVRQIEKSLENQTGAIETHLFTYDAWLHQNDPPRRAFLEALIGNLTAKNLVKMEDWEERLANLTGRSEETETETTRRLSDTGKWIFLSLALVPLGLGFLDFDLVSKAFGSTPTFLERFMFWLSLTLTSAPLLVVLFFYVWWRPWKAVFADRGLIKSLFTKKLWLEHNENHKDESILALLTNQSVERSENKTKISPDPTAIEFRAVFRDVLISLHKHKKRLVIVVDNLDRLAESDAMQLWATIRSLFLGGERTVESDAGVSPPAIILPIDESAIVRMFSIDHPDDAKRLAAAFIDKTFDIAFHVNEPVMSDWRRYLSEKLSEAFGTATTPEHIYWATKFVEERFARDRNEEKITPRKLIKLVNSTAALAAQWGDSIDFEAMIFFALYRQDLSADLVGFVQKDQSLAGAVSDWRRQIVALNFGVAPEKAFQVLLHEPLRSAISEMDRDEFDRLIEVEGAWTIIEEIVDQPPVDAAGSKTDAEFVGNAAILISAAAGSEHIPARRALNKLGRIWPASGHLGSMRSDFGDIVTSLATQITVETAPAFLRTSAHRLGYAMSVSAIDHTTTTAFLAAIKALEEVANAYDLKLPRAPLTLDAEALIELLAQLPPSRSRNIQSDKSAAEIGAALAEGLTDKNAPNIPEAILALIGRDTSIFKDKGKIDWDAVANAAGALIQENGLVHQGTGPALDVLGLLHASKATARNQITNLADQGRLKALLDEADSEEAFGQMADIATLMLLRGADVVGPNGKDWDQVLQDQKDFASEIDKALARYRPSERTMAALNARGNAPSFIPVIRALVRLNVTANTSDHITASYLLANLPQLAEDIGDELLTTCIAHVSKRDDFFTSLDKLESSASYDEAVQRVNMVEGVDKKLLTAHVRARLEGADQNTWVDAIKQGTAPYALAQTFRADFGQKSLGGEGISSALTETRSDLLTSDSAMRERWFALAAFASKGVRATMLRSLRDALLAGNDVTDLDDLIKTGGETLMTVGKFDDEPDKTARHIVLPLVSHELGRSVLRSELSFFSSVVAKSEPETKAAILEALDAITDGGEEQDEVAEDLKEALRLR
ncbi:P-loop NTPase fold protein [Citromicrobium bathyomarinum]